LLSKAQAFTAQLSKVQIAPSRHVVNYQNTAGSSGPAASDSLKNTQQSIKTSSVNKSSLSSALTSSKMMMALHKKCNSIVTTPITVNQASQQFLFQKDQTPRV
jgi:hypothetical protein